MIILISVIGEHSACTWHWDCWIPVSNTALHRLHLAPLSSHITTTGSEIFTFCERNYPWWKLPESCVLSLLGPQNLWGDGCLHLAPVGLHAYTDQHQVCPSHGADGANTGLPALQFEAFWVGRVIGEAVSIMVVHLSAFVVCLLIDDPPSIQHTVAAGLLLQVVEFEVRALMKNVNSIPI